MFKKIKVGILLSTIISTLLLSSLASAQSSTADDNDIFLYTEIQSSNFVEVDKPIILTAKPQFDTEEVELVKYKWYFGDGNNDEGQEVAHNFATAGPQLVKLEVVANKDGKESVFKQEKEIFVAKKAALLISDQSNEQEKVYNFIENAENSEIYLPLIESFTSQSQFLSEEVLARKLSNEEELLNKMEIIFVWTEGGAGLNALLRYMQATDNDVFSNTSIVLLVDDFKNVTRVERQFKQLKPKEIILLEESARHKYYDNPDLKDFKNSLLSEEHKIITSGKTKITPWNFLSFFIDFLTEKGIPDNTLILILLLPVIATTISIMKQVVGLKTLGIYTPSIITLTFLVLGLHFGLLTLLVIIALGILTHKALKPLKLLYIPKMALTLTTVSITILILLTLTVYLNIFDIEYISLAIFPVIIMGTLTEKFVSLRSEKGLPVSLIIMLETCFVSLVAFFLTGGEIDLYFFQIQWSFIQNLVLNHPESLALTIAINIYFGRWTGLRLSEYIQFSEVFKNIEE